MIDIIVPVFNQIEKTKMFVESLKQQEVEINLIIINNGSDNETSDYLKTLNAILINNIENKGYVKAINQGIKKSTSEIVCFANNDIILPKGMLSLLSQKLVYTDLVGPLSTKINPESDDMRLIDFTFKNFDSLNYFFEDLKIKNKNSLIDIDYLYGHFILMKRNVLDAIGGLDESFGQGNYDDVDFCKRAKLNGFRISLAQDCFIHHFCHTTFNAMNISVASLMEKNKKYFEEKWSEHL